MGYHCTAIVLSLRHHCQYLLRYPYSICYHILACHWSNSVRNVLIIVITRENSRHFLTPPLVSPRNDVCRTSVEIPLLMTRYYPYLVSASDWSCPRGFVSTNQKPYSDLDSDTSSVRNFYCLSDTISRETSGGIGKCRLFSRAKCKSPS